MRITKLPRGMKWKSYFRRKDHSSATKQLNMVKESFIPKFFRFPPHYFKLQRQTHKLSHHYIIETQESELPALKQRVSGLKPVIVGPCSESRQSFDAYKLLDETFDWDVVSATTILGRYTRSHRHREAISIYMRMLVLDIRPNEFTFGTMILSSTALKNLNLGKQFHAFATKMGLESNVFVGSVMLDLYTKLSTIEEAQRVFEDIHNPNVVSYTTLITGYLKKNNVDDALKIFRLMPERNAVTWNAMISGYSQTGHNEDAVNFFIEMLRVGMLPTQTSFPSAITAASNIAAIGMGKSFHACAIKYVGNIDTFISNSLISFYAKCGSMEDSFLVFSKLPKRNVVSWNALICGYAQNGRAKEALNSFHQMQSSGLTPNSVTLLGLLWACNHAGLVDDGYSYFNQARLKNPGLLTPEHYSCMVDLLSRAGRLVEAKKFISDLPFDPGIGFWKALLGGCQIHSNMELGEFAAKKIMALDPGDVSSYLMLSNAHSAAGRWQNVSILRDEMRKRGLQRIPGCSWIEIQDQIHVFVNRDEKNDQSSEIYMLLWLFLEHAMESQDSCFLSES